MLVISMQPKPETNKIAQIGREWSAWAREVIVLLTGVLVLLSPDRAEANETMLFYTANPSSLYTSSITGSNIGDPVKVAEGLSTWAKVVPYHVQGKTFLMWYEAGTGNTYYTELGGPTSFDGDTSFIGQLSGDWTHIVPLAIGGKQHLFFYKQAGGFSGIWEMTDSHSLGASYLVGPGLSPGWDQVVGLSHNGGPHLLFYRRSDGLALLVGPVTTSGLGNQIAIGPFDRDWAKIVPFSAPTGTEILFQKDSGQMFRFPLRADGKLGSGTNLGVWSQWTDIRGFTFKTSNSNDGSAPPGGAQGAVFSVGEVIDWVVPPVTPVVTVTGTPFAGLWLGSFTASGTGIVSRGAFNLMGAWVPVTVTTDPVAGTMLVDASVSLPYPAITDDLLQPISQGFQATFDRNGTIVGGGLGAFIPGPLKLGTSKKFEINLWNFNMQINPSQDFYALSGEIEMAPKSEGSARSVCDIPNFLNKSGPGFRRFGAGFQVRNNELNQISLNANNLLIQLASSPFYLDLISAGVGNLNRPDDLFIGGRLRILGGCPLPIVGAPVSGTLDGQVYANTGAFNLTGAAALFRIPLARASVNHQPVGGSSNTAVGGGLGFGDVFTSDVSLSMSGSGGISGSASGRIQIPSDLPIVGPIFGNTKVSTSASFDNKGFRGSLSLPISDGVPEYCPSDICVRVCAPWPFENDCWSDCWSPPCTPGIPAVKASFSFDYKFADNALGFGDVTKNSMGRPDLTGTFRSSIPGAIPESSMQFLNNYYLVERVPLNRRLARRNLPAEAGDGIPIEVPEGLPGGIIRLTYENADITEAHFALTLPDGTVLSTREGHLPEGYAEVDGFSEINPDYQETFMLFLNPTPGEYVLNVENIGDLGDCDLEIIAQDDEPGIAIESVQEAEEEEGVYLVEWIDEDLEGGAEVLVYLDQDDEGDNGVFIGSLPAEDEEDAFWIDTRDINEVPPGDYFILIGIDDGVNPVRWAYSEDEILVIDPEAPEPVTSIASVEGDQSMQISWRPSATQDVVGYQVIYTSDDEFSDFEGSRVVGRNALSTTIDGLENGQSYLVSVLALREGDHVSLPEVVHRVTPSRAYGEVKPRITSIPDEDATVGYQWLYLPQVYNADVREGRRGLRIIDLEGVEATEIEGSYDVEWELLEGPEGMELDTTSGLIGWIPASGIEGLHTVTVRATEIVTIQEGADIRSRRSPTEQSFELLVLPESNISALEEHPYSFASTPSLWAKAGETYRYEPAVISPEGGFELHLFEGPDGMRIEGNEVIWDVPAEAEGTGVLLCAELADGTLVEHDYFLHVETTQNRIPRAVEIFDVTPTEEGIALNWAGDGPLFQVQRKVSLEDEAWVNLGNPTSNGFFEDFVDTDAPEGGAFYRVLVVTD